MPKVTEWGDPAHVRVLLHGDTGAGKTYLAGTAALVPEMRPVLFFDFEEGRRSIFNIPGISREDITFFVVKDDKEIALVEKVITRKPGPFKTVVIDSLTEMYGLMMSIWLESKDRADSPPQLQDYGFVTNRMMKFLRKVIRRSKVHFIATAGTALDKDELSGEIHQQPDILGKLNYRSGRFFGLVGFVRTEYTRRGTKLSVKRTLQIQPFRRVRAKNRYGDLPAVLADPTLQKIYNAAYGRKEVEADVGTNSS